MKNAKIFLFGLTVLLAVMIGTVSAQPIASCSGVVLDEATELPIADVEVTAYLGWNDSIVVTTDQDGAFLLEFFTLPESPRPGHPNPPVHVMFEHPDYFHYSLELEIAEGDFITDQVISLSQEEYPYDEYSISGHVENEEGEPVVDVPVFAMGQSDPNMPPFMFIVDGTTDENGDYTINAPEGDYRIACGFHNGFPDSGQVWSGLVWYDGVDNPEDATVITVDQDVTGIDFVFDIGDMYEISGVATNGDGDPISNASIFVISDENYRPFHTMTDENGLYSISVIEGDYTVGCFSFQGDFHGMTIWYDGVNSPEDATVITVDQDITGIDFVFDLGDMYTVSGTVTDNNGNPISNAEVFFTSNFDIFPPDSTFSERYFDRARTDENGNYSVQLIEEEYIAGCLIFSEDIFMPITIWYDGADNPEDATVITVNQDITGIDFSFDLTFHNVSGRVADEDGNPVANAEVWLVSDIDPNDPSRPYWTSGRTDESGEYNVSVLAGDYRVNCMHPDHYINLWYDQATSYDDATVITVDQDVTGIDFTFEGFHTVTGSVLNADGEPASYAEVMFFRTDGYYPAWTTTDESGEYSVALYEGLYYAQAILMDDFQDPNDPNGNFMFSISIWYDGVTNFADATPITVSDDVVGINFDFSIIEFGSISGQVTDQETGQPMADAWVSLMPTTQDSLYGGFFPGLGSCVVTDAEGNYEIDNVPEGEYIVSCFGDNRDYIPLFYDQAVDYFDATPVVLQSPDLDVTGIDFALFTEAPEAGESSIRGSIYDADGQPISGSQVIALPIEDNFNQPTFSTISDEEGSYLLENLPEGDYILLAAHDGYIPTYYTDPDWNDGDYVLSLEHIIEVTIGTREDLVDIDIYLYPTGDFGGGISGNVTTSNVIELRLAVVYAIDDQNQVVSGGLSLFDGEFTVPDLPSGVYTIQATRVGYHEADYDLPITLYLEEDPVIDGVHIDLIPMEVLDNEDGSDTPQDMQFGLDQNYPNPFNPSTTIHYTLPGACHVQLNVYNAMGQLVKTLVDKDQPAGKYEARWDGENLNGEPAASGVYFYRMEAGDQGDFTARKRMVLMK